VGGQGAARAPPAGGEAAAPAVGGAPVWDEATVVGGGRWPQARPRAGADGMPLDRPGIPPPAGGAPRREAAAPGRPGLRWAGRKVVMRAAAGQPSAGWPAISPHGRGAVWSCGPPLPRKGQAEFLGRRVGAGNRGKPSVEGFDTVWRCT
jgi:hypothetical protein